MDRGDNLTRPKYLVSAAYVIMVTANVLAERLPINGVTTGAVSDGYPNLFTPAGITFAIWGLIYVLLLGYTVYQWDRGGGESGVTVRTMQNVRGYFIFSCLANAAWILAWHYYLIWLSVLLIVVILVCLLQIASELRGEKLTRVDKLLLGLPFSVYFGWITVATIANITVLLVDWGFSGLGLSQPVWTVIVLLLGLLISMGTAYRNLDIAYALVIIWAYAGILLQHLSRAGFAGKYPSIVTTLAISLVIMVMTIGAIIMRLQGRSNPWIITREEI